MLSFQCVFELSECASQCCFDLSVGVLPNDALTYLDVLSNSAPIYLGVLLNVAKTSLDVLQNTATIYLAALLNVAFFSQVYMKHQATNS